MKKSLFAIAFLFVLVESGWSQSVWSFELHAGSVLNVPLPLTIRQEGYPGMHLIARFRTEAFIPPVYWDGRISRWENRRSWEVELIHQKLYLKNTTSEIQKFNISHGFNLLMANRGFDCGKFRIRTGAGIVLAHPESKIRGREFGDTTDDFDLGYFVSGSVANVALAKPVQISSRLFVNLETKATFAYAHIKIADGSADVFNLAFHLIVGLGFNFRKT